MQAIIKWMIYLSILTTSFDVFLVVQLGGTVRFCQMIMIIPYTYLFIRSISNRKIILPSHIKWLLIWSVFILAFVLNTNRIGITVGYYIWLMLNVLNIFLLVNFFDKKQSVLLLVRFYGWSFTLVALFGLFQFFAAPILKFSTPLVGQWWIPGVLARINGFSYEPSYFATYELIGWTMVFALLKFNDETIYSKYKRNFIFIVLSTAMVLSSSRMGILMMLVVVVASYFNKILYFFTKLSKGYVYTSFLRRAIVTLLSVIVLINVATYFIDFEQYDFLLSGTGINGAASHSVDGRSLAVEQTWNVFLENPIIGVSLGGVSENIASDMGVIDSDTGLGCATFLEVLAASGIIGIIPFCIYFIKLVWNSGKVFFIKRDYVGLSLVYALLAEIVILQFNQNILRPYFWMHLAILSAYLFVFGHKNYNYIKRGYDE